MIFQQKPPQLRQRQHIPIALVLILLFTAGCGSTPPKAGPATEITLPGGVTMHLMTVPEGSFQVGPAPQPYPRPETTVTFAKPMLVGIHEVTQAQYRSVTGSNPSHFVASQTAKHGTGRTMKPTGYANTDNQPAESILWHDAVRFCNALSAQQNLRPCYSALGGGTTIGNKDSVVCDWDANGFRLPTEAEWEYFCRAGTNDSVSYGWGDDESEATMKNHAWYGGNAFESSWTAPHADKPGTQPVGTNAANGFGLFDMHGNVAEYCWDLIDINNPSAIIEPGPDERKFFRAVRGGSYLSKPGADLRSRHRQAHAMVNGATYIGFRVVRVP